MVLSLAADVNQTRLTCMYNIYIYIHYVWTRKKTSTKEVAFYRFHSIFPTDPWKAVKKAMRLSINVYSVLVKSTKNNIENGNFVLCYFCHACGQQMGDRPRKNATKRGMLIFTVFYSGSV